MGDGLEGIFDLVEAALGREDGCLLRGCELVPWWHSVLCPAMHSINSAVVVWLAYPGIVSPRHDGELDERIDLLETLTAQTWGCVVLCRVWVGTGTAIGLVVM